MFGHQSFSVLWLGKSCFSFINLPFESIKMTISGCAFLILVVLGVYRCCWRVSLSGCQGGSAGVWVAFELGCMMVSVCSLRLSISLCRSALP